MKTIAKLLTWTAIVASTVFIAAITAKADHPWSGCGIEAHAGISSSKTAVNVSGVNADLGANAGVGGIGVGCDVQLGRLVVGGLGRYTWGAASADLLNKSLQTTVDRSWMVGGRAGVAITKSLLGYGLIGYSRGDAKLELAGVDSTTVTPGGIVLGVGAEVLLEGNWALKIEGDWRRPKAQGANLLGVDFSTQVEAFTGIVGVSYRFPVEQPAALANVKPLM